jgi:hypothetical protein
MEERTRERGEAYRPPFVREISLAAEEVLAVGCKLSNGGSNVGPPTCITTIMCAAAGS